MRHVMYHGLQLIGDPKKARKRRLVLVAQNNGARLWSTFAAYVAVGEDEVGSHSFYNHAEKSLHALGLDHCSSLVASSVSLSYESTVVARLPVYSIRPSRCCACCSFPLAQRRIFDAMGKHEMEDNLSHQE